MQQQIEARLAALEKELEAFVQQANGVIASYRGGINELKRLLEPEPAKAEPAVQVAEHPQRGPDWRDGIETK